MAISYKKLWKLLIDKDLKKKDLQRISGISAASITKLAKNENVNMEIIEKVCLAEDRDEVWINTRLNDSAFEFVVKADFSDVRPLRIILRARDNRRVNGNV